MHSSVLLFLWPKILAESLVRFPERRRGAQRTSYVQPEVTLFCSTPLLAPIHV
jgi:hypothetical protein